MQVSLCVWYVSVCTLKSMPVYVCNRICMCASCMCTCVPGGDRIALKDQWDLLAGSLTQSSQGCRLEPGLG